MRVKIRFAIISIATIVGMGSSAAQAQGVGKYLAPRDQAVAIRAGKLFDSKSGTMLSNQIVVIRGDRIADVGAGIAIPDGARVIDLGSVTVMPGMIDAHVHLNTGGNQGNLAQRA